MKLIGKNSVSKYISYFLFLMFVVVSLHLVYEMIGHAFLLYKYHTGSKIFSETFLLGNDVGWAKNKWTIPLSEELKFRINYPFSGRQLVTGFYEFPQILMNLLGFLYISLFFYFSYRIFREISSDKIFNTNAILWLKRFGFLNLIFSGLLLLQSLFLYKISPSGVMQYVFIGIIGIVILFIVEFFKKGHELQSENDLTI